MSDKKEVVAKVELTPEQKAEAKLRRMEDDFVMMTIGLVQKDEKKQATVFSRLKGKITTDFADAKIAAGELSAKQKETLIKFKLIGERKERGEAGPRVERDWRWQIGAEKESNPGKALMSIEASIKKLEEDHKADFATVCQWLSDNKENGKDFIYSFATYFARAKKVDEKAKDAKTTETTK